MHGKFNPANHRTRDLKPSELEEKWLQGPKFLFQDHEHLNFDQRKILTTTKLVLQKCLNPVKEGKNVQLGNHCSEGQQPCTKQQTFCEKEIK